MNKDGKKKMLIAITTYTSGDAQSTRVDDIATSISDEFEVIVLTSFADQNRLHQNFPKIIVIKSYFLSFLSIRVRELFKSSDLVIVETGLPYAFCSFLFKSNFVWILYGPDKGIHFSGSYFIKNKLNTFLERNFILRSAKFLITPAEWVSKFYRAKGMNVETVPAAINQNIFYPKMERSVNIDNLKLIPWTVLPRLRRNMMQG